MLVTQNMRNKDMFNMEQYNIDNIEENEDSKLNFILMVQYSVTVNSANLSSQHFALRYISIREEQ